MEFRYNLKYVLYYQHEFLDAQPNRLVLKVNFIEGGRLFDLVSVTSVNTAKQTFNITTKVKVGEPRGPSVL